MSDGYYMEFVPTWKQRLGCKLFPQRNHATIPSEKLKSSKDIYSCGMVVHLDIFDRLRILFSGRIRMEVKCATENEIGAHATETSFNVLPFKSLE